MIIPKVDDCISLLIGSQKQREKIGREKSRLFSDRRLARGSVTFGGISVQHPKIRSGDGRRHRKTLYGHYKTLALLDTPAAPIEQLVENTKMISETFELEQIILPATTQYIKALFSGVWPTEKFVVIQPQSKVSETDFLI